MDLECDCETIFNPNNVIAEWLCTYSVLSMNDEDDR